jgi:hypothetical protein
LVSDIASKEALMKRDCLDFLPLNPIQAGLPVIGLHRTLEGKKVKINQGQSPQIG